VEIRAAHAASKGTYEHHVCRLILRKPAFVSVANVWPGVAMRKSSGSISARRVRISPAPRQADVLQAYVRDADGDARKRPDRADNRRATLHAAVSDVFKIVGRCTVSEQCGLNCRDYHSMHAMWARNEKRWQARRADLLVTHGNLQVPAPGGRPVEPPEMPQAASATICAKRPCKDALEWSRPHLQAQGFSRQQPPSCRDQRP
jgi:hypothetical protein